MAAVRARCPHRQDFAIVLLDVARPVLAHRSLNELRPFADCESPMAER
jgi:hypothetical protein